MDLAPLRGSRDFRLLLASRTVTGFGTQAAAVALLVQARQLTGSTFAVGMLGAVELVPLVVFGLWGGVLADRFDRRQLLRWCETGLGCCAALLTLNALAPQPAVWPLYAVAAAMMALAALQRPSLEAAIPRVVPRDQLTAAAALLSASQDGNVIAGSALGGVLAAGPGPWTVYTLDAASFAVSFALLCGLRPLATAARAGRPSGLGSLLDGLRYASRRPDLLGSYLVDLAAMVLAYPDALLPFLAAQLRAAWATGLMFAAPSAGALAVSLASRRMGRVRRHGLAIALAAASWGLAVAALGLAPDLAVALGCLVASGAADMVSGIFRDTLWNQTIPDAMRGRMAGVELLSYSLGPSAGQVRGGLVAALAGARLSLTAGGLACAGAVGLVCLALPGFTAYRAAPAGPVGGHDSAERLPA